MLKWTLLTLTTIAVAAAAAYLFYLYPIEFKNPFSEQIIQLNKPVTTLSKTLFLELAEPQNDILTFESSTKLSGKTLPDTSLIISTSTQDYLIKSDAEGNFSTTLNLAEGVNNINVVAFEEDGNKKSETRVIYFSEEKI